MKEIKYINIKRECITPLNLNAAWLFNILIFLILYLYMRIFITGGTGLIGSTLIHNLLDQGHSIAVLSRNIIKAEQKLGSKVDFFSTLESMNTLDDYDAVINLAGEPLIGKRWTERQKEKLCNSRWNITQGLTELIKRSNKPPRVFISGSAVGYYGAQNSKILDENAVPHDEFSYQLCNKWEQLALDAQSEQTRVCILRTGIVLSKSGGMLPLMLLPFRMGLGATLGKGDQYISWIHMQDMVNAINFLLNTSQAQGIFNLSAPNPETNRYFSNTLADTINRPRIFCVPSIILKIVMGEVAVMVTKGQRVMPQHLLALGFRFRFEHLDESLNDILNKN